MMRVELRLDPDTEAVLDLGNGLELRCPAYPADCEYVRVVRERDGVEIAYWDYHEWQDDPLVVMGAIIGACFVDEEDDLFPTIQDGTFVCWWSEPEYHPEMQEVGPTFFCPQQGYNEFDVLSIAHLGIGESWIAPSPLGITHVVTRVR